MLKIKFEIFRVKHAVLLLSSTKVLRIWTGSTDYWMCFVILVCVQIHFNESAVEWQFVLFDHC